MGILCANGCDAKILLGGRCKSRTGAEGGFSVVGTVLYGCDLSNHDGFVAAGSDQLSMGGGGQPIPHAGVPLVYSLRNPSAHRSLIAFAAWSSFARAAVTAVMILRDVRARGEWPAVVILTVIGAALLVLNRAKQPAERAVATDT